jgi:hypothetical protein
MIRISKQEFSTEHLSGDRPVLISGGLSDWPAFGRWSPRYLAAAAADNIVDVATSLTGVFLFNPDGTALDPANQFVIANVPFKDGAEFIMDESQPTPKYYISQQSLQAKLPQLVPDLRFPQPAASSHLNLWFGSAGTVTPLHFDSSNNCYAQIYGSKQFTLFAPQDTPYLYPYPAGTQLSHLSHVDPEHPDWDSYPLLRQATALTFTITAGQLLFLPAFWWHHVRSLSISISVSQWWEQ